MELQQETQMAELKKAMKDTKNKHLRECYQAFCLHLNGHKIQGVAQLIGHTQKTIGSCAASYPDGGVEALNPRHSEDRPLRLNKEQEVEIKEIILTKLPLEVGFDSHSNWILTLLVLFVE